MVLTACKFFLLDVSSIHCSMGSSPVGVQCTLDYTIFHASLSCAFLFRMYISLLHHSFTSSSHSLFGVSLFVFPFISPNTTPFTSLLSSILQMCPNKFNFLSLILCMIFLCYPFFSLFLHSRFPVAILHLEFFGCISSQMPSVCSCLFSSTSTFHMHTILR